MRRAGALVVGLLLVGTILIPGPTAASLPSKYEPVAGVEFTAVVVEGPHPTGVPDPDLTPARTAPPRPQARPAPRSLPVVHPPIRTKPAALGSSVTGTASWYCKAGVSVCHHAYPPGKMVAAACLKLRRVMGSDWRGTFVTVKGPSNSVRVQLVDFCASTTKLIDLYWAPMHALGGTGTLPVKVSW